jgi:group I intron endonuclease
MKYYVYKITNTVTGWVYIGTTIALQVRWKTHKSKMQRGKHNIIRMQEDCRKYGVESFVFEVVAILSTGEEMMGMEKSLIKECVANGSCYNLYHNSFDARLENFHLGLAKGK